MKIGTSYSANGFEIRPMPMIISATMVGAAAIIGISGMVVGGSHVFSAARMWFRGLEVPPGEIAKHKWGQTMAATHAGASAWQRHNGIQRTHA